MSHSTNPASPKASKPQAADYLKFVEWSVEDGCFVGSAPPIIGPCCHGPDEVKVHRELCVIVEEWLEIMQHDGIPIPLPPKHTEAVSR